ncbi:MAG: ANTAR domain-containing protein [Lawsonibacter sp.]|nr:ANTAR domain-containing protein [Lawsonibacter sp.]
MDTVIVAFENAALNRQFSDLLERTETARCLTCRSGDQVRRLVSKQTVYCAVCSPRLPDGPAEWLFQDLPPTCSLLLVGPQHTLDACASQDVFKLTTPLRREEAVSTVRLLLQFGHRMERIIRPRRTPLEQELVDRAKQLLMDRDGLTEEEAHRVLQKRSMDAGARLSQTARQLLAES